MSEETKWFNGLVKKYKGTPEWQKEEILFLKGECVAMEDKIAALKQENERLNDERVGWIKQMRVDNGYIKSLESDLAAAEARVKELEKCKEEATKRVIEHAKGERELREKVEDFLSCERIIRDAGIMDNYTDAARARNRQAAIINEWKQLLGGEK